jgi:hypothetical protein
MLTGEPGTELGGRHGERMWPKYVPGALAHIAAGAGLSTPLQPTTATTSTTARWPPAAASTTGQRVVATTTLCACPGWSAAPCHRPTATSLADSSPWPTRRYTGTAGSIGSSSNYVTTAGTDLKYGWSHEQCGSGYQGICQIPSYSFICPVRHLPLRDARVLDQLSPSWLRYIVVGTCLCTACTHPSS